MLRRRPLQGSGNQEEDKFISKNEAIERSSSIFIKIVTLVIFVLYVLPPLSVYYCPTIRRHAVFMPYVGLSRLRNLSRPEDYGLSSTRHFYINSTSDIKLGAWHISPPTVMSNSKSQNGFTPASEEFNDNRPVFLYLHGISGTRGTRRRIELYKFMSEKLNAHVITFDYRGFGDSSNISPTESGLVEDTHHVYEWLAKRVNPSRIFIWGHSLGTGVGVAFTHKLSTNLPAALILEAPFTRVIDAVKDHPLSIFHRYLPFFDLYLAKSFGDKDTGFDSISRINQVKCAILILHAEDDGIVPFDHGKKLYDFILKSRKNIDPERIQFVGFDEKLDLGHRYIYKSPELPNIVKQFMNKLKLKSSKL